MAWPDQGDLSTLPASLNPEKPQVSRQVPELPVATRQTHFPLSAEAWVTMPPRTLRKSPPTPPHHSPEQSTAFPDGIEQNNTCVPFKVCSGKVH